MRDKFFCRYPKRWFLIEVISLLMLVWAPGSAMAAAPAPIIAQRPARSSAALAALRFRGLQQQLRNRAFAKPTWNGTRARTLVIPSMSLDSEELEKISGVEHYEERSLYELLRLRDPKREVVYVSSTPIDPAIVDYYLGLLPGGASATRDRLTMLTAADASAKPLTQKILERPALMRSIRRSLDRHATIEPFITSPLEQQLSARLRVPLIGTDPVLGVWGSKTGSRALFAEAGVAHPDGYGNLRNVSELERAVTDLWTRHPSAGRIMVKLNEGFSGEGNAILDLRDVPGRAGLSAAARAAEVHRRLPRLQPVADGISFESFARRIGEMGAIAELFVEGKGKRSPSVQGFVHPNGEVEILSTHEQILGGPDDQVYLGARFPADPEYGAQLQTAGLQIGRSLAQKGAIGRFAVDFVVVPRAQNGGGQGWDVQALEINLRKGGTTHPLETAKLLTNATYDSSTGLLRSARGVPKAYVATDNVKHEGLRGLTPAQLLAAARARGIDWDAATQTGVVFHLLGALPRFGKLGFTAVANSQAEADELYRSANAALEQLATSRASRR